MKALNMLTRSIFKTALLAACLGTVNTSPAPPATTKVQSEALVVPSAVRAAPKPVAPVTAKIQGLTVLTNTSTVAAKVAAPAAVVAATTVQATVLIFGRDSVSAYSAFSGLNGHGIPYQVVVVPQAGITLPTLNTSTTAGNYGAIVILSEISYDYGGTTGFQSALTAAQWATLYQYQVSFGVRMVRLDVYPSADSGTTALGGCCNTGVEQLISISNAAGFPTAGLKTYVFLYFYLFFSRLL
jgi:hypothetical protein